MPIWIAVVLLAIVEGLTEFIPVSSTGHLLITETLFKKFNLLPADCWLLAGGEQKDLFNIVIQSGAVLAVIPLFHQRFQQFIFRWRDAAVRDYFLKICVAFFITGAGGFVLDKKGFKLPEQLQPVAAALIVGGILFVIVELVLRGKSQRDAVTWDIVIVVGLGQLLAAIFPGASRSGATILFSLILGLNRPLATEFSFLVGIPTMLAAGGLKIFKALHHHHGAGTEWGMVILGTIVAAIVSFIAVKWLLRFVQTHTFIGFGWYRLAAGALILLALI